MVCGKVLQSVIQFK